MGNYQLKNPQDKDITLEKIQGYIEYKGNKVECEIADINEDGTIYLDKCKVNNKDVEYTYGKKKDKSIIVYRCSDDIIKIGDTINPNDTTEFTTDPTIFGTDFYFKHVVDNENKITESYVCLVFNDKEVCLRGGSPSYYEKNALILKGLENEGFGCNLDEYFSQCWSKSKLSLGAGSDGEVRMFFNGSPTLGEPQLYFYVKPDGSSYYVE